MSYSDARMSSAAVESAGPKITDFAFHKPISQGAFGEVYLGWKKCKPETKLAIKVMDKDHLRNKNMLEQASNNFHLNYKLSKDLLVRNSCKYMYHSWKIWMDFFFRFSLT